MRYVHVAGLWRYSTILRTTRAIDEQGLPHRLNLIIYVAHTLYEPVRIKKEIRC